MFAKKLTYKVPVTPWNLKALQEMVRNGPDVHPGACFVENSDDGRRVAVSPDSETQRNALAKTLLAPGDSSQVCLGLMSFTSCSFGENWLEAEEKFWQMVSHYLVSIVRKCNT